MIVGVPNSGKSSIINALLRTSGRQDRRPRRRHAQLQWFRLAPDVELMDTPGILPPKIATRGGTMEARDLRRRAARPLRSRRTSRRRFIAGCSRSARSTAVPDLESFARTRGFVRRGGEIDYHNAAQSYISAFNDGAFGRISFGGSR